MTANRGDEGWSTWDSVTRLATQAGYISLGAAVMVVRSTADVWRAARRALDEVAANTSATRALGVALRRTGRSRRRGTSAAGQSASVDAGSPGATARPELQSETQWVVWTDAACEAEWAGDTLQLDWPAPPDRTR